MSRRASIAALILCSLPPAVATPAGPDAGSAFARLKRLAGEWKGTVVSPTGPPVTVRYAVTSGGSAVTEALFPGTDHEMLTVYHLDGATLVGTHYCAMANQPRFRLASFSDQEAVFAFAGGTNIDPARDGHMHEGRIRFLADDRLEAEWAVHEGGKQTGANRFYLSRQK
jgi:hypothetical protein